MQTEKTPRNIDGSFERRERKNANVYLNEYVAYYALNFITKSGLWDKFQSGGSITLNNDSSKIERGAIEHLDGMGYLFREGQTYTKKLSVKFPTSQQFYNAKEAVLKMAEFQEKVIRGKATSVRKQVIESAYPQELIALSGTCLMESSYKDFLSELYEEYRGVRSDTSTRTQPENAWGAGVMMEPAARRIAAELANYVVFNKIKNPQILELGSGNASTLAAILDEFKAQKLGLPKVLASDKDESTSESARGLFKKRGYESDFSWRRVDMGDTDDLRKAKRILGDENVFIHIGYILHESNLLAERTLNALRKVFPDATFLFTEYYLQDTITSQVPLHFQTIHTLSGQELKSRSENIDRAKRFGYEPVEGAEIVHNWVEKTGKSGIYREPLNSTILFKFKD